MFSFFICLVIVLVPVTSIFIFAVSSSAQLVILSIGSSFFWLLAILVTSLFESVIPVFVLVPVSVFFQEGVRLGFWLLYDKAYNKGFFKDDKSKPSTFMSAVAIGWGFGFTQLMLTYVSALTHATGPGLLPAPSCPAVSVFYVTGLTSLALSLAHVIWNVIVFDGYNKSSYWPPALVLLLHILTVQAPIVTSSLVCWVSVVIAYALLLVAALLFWYSIVKQKNSLISKRLNYSTRNIN